MRKASLIVLALSSVILGNSSALAADSGPVIVVPGRPGVPVMINGIDVTGAVLEGDWGLYKPHMVGPTIIPVPVFIPRPVYRVRYDHVGHVEGGYYPALGRQPGYGRHEIEPPADRILPPPAPSFHRSWSSQPEPLPANLDPPPPSPPLIVSPQIFPGGQRGDNARPSRSETSRSGTRRQ
jgi:hypothetical protein